VEPAALACPKCGADRREGARACSRCGLAVDRMAAFAKEREDVPERLVTAWDRAEWSDARAHDDLLQLAHTLDAYPWLAAKYRARTPGDDALAQERLARIQKAMEVTLLASATPKPDKAGMKYRGLIAILALVVLAAVLLYVVIKMRDTGPEPLQPTIEIKEMK
jgi:hypothetical protein